MRISLTNSGSVKTTRDKLSVTDTYKIVDTRGGLEQEAVWGQFFGYVINAVPNRADLWWESVDINADEGSAGVMFTGSVVYSNVGKEREDRRKFPKYSFSTKGGTAHVTHSISTRQGIVVAGRQLPDFKRAINVDRSGPQGVDIVCPAWQHSMSIELPGETVTWNFRNKIAGMTGKVNSSPMWMFPAGSLLFRGLDGNSSVEVDPQTQIAREWYSLSFDFEGMPPRQSGSVMSGSLIHRLHAWQIRLKAIPRLLAIISTPPFVNTLDHQILVLHREPDFRVYYPANGWLVGQAAGVSSLSGQYNPERWREDSRAITGAPTCQFEWRAGKFTCPICGRALSSTTPNNPPIALCRPLPPIRKRVRHYIAAVAGHLAGGCQTRTDEEVADLLAICHSCGRFNPKRQSCSLCGCRCTAGTSGFLNKLRMKTESCPRGKWK